MSICNATGVAKCGSDSPFVLTPQVVAVYPHDPGAFTQGLVYNKGKLFESTGLFGKSSLRILDTNGNIEKKIPIPEIFTEGCTILYNKLYQLTWKEMQCLVYSLPDLSIRKIHSYTGEGWGLTTDNTYLIMSNGTDTLFIRDTTFAVQKKVAVRYNKKPLVNINELEYARGSIYANVWYDTKIYEIDPFTGNVRRVIDCTSIVQQEKIESEHNVLNGIAYIPVSDRFYITGKNWNHLYLVTIPK